MKTFHLVSKIWQDWQIYLWIMWEVNIQNQFHFQFNFVTWFIFKNSFQATTTFQVLWVIFRLTSILYFLGQIPIDLTRLVGLIFLNLSKEQLLEGFFEKWRFLYFFFYLWKIGEFPLIEGSFNQWTRVFFLDMHENSKISS